MKNPIEIRIRIGDGGTSVELKTDPPMLIADASAMLLVVAVAMMDGQEMTGNFVKATQALLDSVREVPEKSYANTTETPKTH